MKCAPASLPPPRHILLIRKPHPRIDPDYIILMQGVANSFTSSGALKLIITFNFAGLIIIALSFFLNLIKYF